MDLILILNERESEDYKKEFSFDVWLRVYFYYNQKLEGFNQRTSLFLLLEPIL
jgi:hypothetical protein